MAPLGAWSRPVMDGSDEKANSGQVRESPRSASKAAGWLQNLVFLLCGIGLNICYAIYLAYIKVIDVCLTGGGSGFGVTKILGGLFSAVSKPIFYN